jgi:2-methylcitrate dehydratase PrpD
MSLTQRFAQTLLDLASETELPPAQAIATSLLIDGIAVGALGAGQRGPRILAGLAIEQQGAQIATLLGQSRRVTPAEAARVNGAAMHVLDYEPMWNPANHSLSTTLPAVLACAEMLGRRDHPGPIPDGKTLLAALVLGIEAQQRIRMASGQLEPGLLMFHPPGAVGALGSAMACGFLLGLNLDQFKHALGIAASRAAGVQGNVGSMTKALHCGQAAMAGLESALMASRGFTADQDALGGPRGYGRAFYGASFTPEILTAPHPLFVLDPGPAFKFFPSQYGTHFVITAALAARRAWWSGCIDAPAAASIESVEITVPPMPYVDRPLPATGLDGKFSFQYVAAIAILDDRVDVASFTDDRCKAPDVQDLLASIRISADPTRQGRFDRMRADVRIRSRDGRESFSTCDGPPGIWGRAADSDVLAGKALDCLCGLYKADHARKIVTRARDFGAMDGAAVLDFLNALGPQAELKS